MEIKTIKISSEEGDLIVYFEPASGKYTFLSEDKGALFSLSEETMENLLDFTRKLKNPQVVSREKAYNVEDKRKTHPNAYKKWEKEDDDQLIDMWKRGLSVSVMSDELMRNKGAIRSRLSKLGCDVVHEKPNTLVEDNISISLVVEDGYCNECGVQIDPKRLEAVPGAKQCTECASKMPFEKQRIEEPLGSRDDFRKDRNSWRRTNS